MSDLNDRRAEIQRMRKQATKKISRLKVVHGVTQLSGTTLDPRRSPNIEMRYNERQLGAYERSLAAFLSRDVGYVGDSKGRPMRASDWRRYKRAERKMNKRIAERMERIADLPTVTGETIGERIAVHTPSHRQAGAALQDARAEQINRKSTSIASAKALRQLTEATLEQGRKDYHQKRAASGKESFEKMAGVIGSIKVDAELSEIIDSLTPGQFEVLWNFDRDFTKALANAYDLLKKMLSPEQEAWYNKVADEWTEEAKARAKHAKKWDV